MNKDLFIKMDKKDNQNISSEESIFEDAFKCLNNNDVKGFAEKIIELHSILHCDCFFLKKDKEVYKSIWDKLESFEDDVENYHLNYAKYFASKWSKIFIISRNHKFYHAAKKFGNEIDLVILINGGKSKYPVTIAERNFEINKGAKDYYFLARSLSANCISERNEEKVEKIIELYNKAIELEPSHYCAQYQKCMFLLEACNEYFVDNVEDSLSKVIPEFNICLNANISHQQYLTFILKLLSTEIKINGKESIPQQYLFYLYFGRRIYSNKKIYSYLLGRRYLNNGKIEDALQLFYAQGSIADYNENEEKYSKKDLKPLLIRSLSIAMNRMYHSKNYDMVLELSKCYIFLLGDYSYPPYTLLTYLELKDVTINISKENQIYIDLNDRLENDIQFYDLSSEFNFGKYKGQTISQMINNDPDYLLWCVINVDWFALNQRIFTNNWESLKACPYIYIALEYLMIKCLISDEENKRKQLEKEDFDNFDRRENDSDAFYFLTEGNYGSYENAPPDWQDRLPGY